MNILDPSVVNVDEILSDKSKEERQEFEMAVDDYMRDTSRLREYHLPINPDRKTVRQALCKEIYFHS